jgi:hypothetical protein
MTIAEVAAAAVERREGARAYVTGARSTSQGVPVLPRFLLIPTMSAGEEAGEHQGAAFRTSALAALHSLALRGKNAKPGSNRSRGDAVERPPGRAKRWLPAFAEASAGDQSVETRLRVKTDGCLKS